MVSCISGGGGLLLGLSVSIVSAVTYLFAVELGVIGLFVELSDLISSAAEFFLLSPGLYLPLLVGSLVSFSCSIFLVWGSFC